MDTLQWTGETLEQRLQRYDNRLLMAARDHSQIQARLQLLEDKLDALAPIIGWVNAQIAKENEFRTEVKFWRDRGYDNAASIAAEKIAIRKRSGRSADDTAQHHL
jgi:hypothetical protein